MSYPRSRDLLLCRTLLCFKTSCDSCHHAREEHRPQTELDLIIQGEFAIASRNPCTGRVPVHLVSKTSLFGGYDPIPIFNDDTPNEFEGVSEISIKQCMSLFITIRSRLVFHVLVMVSNTQTLPLLV